MKKFFLIALLITNFCFCQNNEDNSFETNYKLLLENLTNQNWEKSQDLAQKLLDLTESVDSMQIQKEVVRYMYIYSTAGLLSEKKLTQKEALKKVLFLKSKQMIMPSHPFNSNCYVNCTNLKDDEPDTFFTGVNNTQGTQIFSFEYVKIKNGIKESVNELEGKYIQLRGELKEITVEGNMLPRFKLKFINGDYKIKSR